MGAEGNRWLRGTDAIVQRRLQADVLRARNVEPHTVLRIASSATKQDVRVSFLALTKVYHPARFARRPDEVQRLANEHFLLIREAYDQALSGPQQDSTKSSVEIRAVAFNATPRSPAEPRERVAEPATTEPASKEPAKTRERLARSTGKRPAAVEVSASSRRAMLSRRGSAAKGKDRQEPRSRVSTSSEVIPTSRSKDSELKDEFEAAKRMLHAGNFSGAAAAFKDLAVRAHDKTQYRIHMHYCNALEFKKNNDLAKASTELKYALRLDPGFEPAKKAASELAGKTPNRGGLFKKLFGD
jgi:curved DNA-binding protein CbpA